MALVPGSTIERWRAVWTGVGGAPYYTNVYTAGSAFSEVELDGWEQFFTDIRDHIVGGVTVTVEGTVAIIDKTTGDITGTESVGADRLVTGNAGAGPLPPSNQALVRWETGEYVSGRELQGRTNIGGLSVAANSGGLVHADVRTALGAAADQLLGLGGSFTDGFNGSMCIWSRTHGQAAYITTHSEPSKFAVLRSRRD